MHKLRVFAHIVEGGSMTAAAGALGISRSVVSAHLKRLEADLGVRLLERTTRSQHVTAIGEEVYRGARRMLDAGQDALDSVDAHLGAVRGVLRVASPAELGPPLIAPALAGLCLAHPDLRVDLLVGDQPVDIVADAVDVAVRLGIPQDSSLILRRLGYSDEVFVASPRFVAEHDLDGDLSKLSGTPRVAHTVVDDLRPTLRRPDGETRTLTLPPPLVRVGTSDLVREFAVRGVGVAVLPACFLQADLEAGRLVRVVAPWTRRRLELYALTPSRLHSPAVSVFLEAIQTRLGGGKVEL